MSPREIFTLRDYLGPELKGRTISDARRVVSLTDSLGQTCLADRLGELSRRSVLLAVSDQLISAIAMTELDGVARRMLLCPPDLNADHVNALIEDAGIDAIVTDHPSRWADADIYLVLAARVPERTVRKAKSERATEWLMLTSGTSGVPKIVGHSLEALTGAIVADGPARGTPPVWATSVGVDGPPPLLSAMPSTIRTTTNPARASARRRRCSGAWLQCRGLGAGPEAGCGRVGSLGEVVLCDIRVRRPMMPVRAAMR